MSEPRKFEWTRPVLYEKQLDAIFCKERYGIIEASTKAGKTVGCISWILEQAAMGQHGWNYWWVAPSYKQAAIAFRRSKSGLTQGTFEANETRLTVTLCNGTVIWFLSGEIPDNLYGEDVFGLVIDEASRIREEAWHALRSTITATRAPARIIGNVKGRKNWFYRLARRAESGAPDMHFSKIRADDAVSAGVLDRSEIDNARAMLPALVFKELYEAEPGDDVGNPFGLAAIARCVSLKSTGVPICYGIDLAKSIDWTVIIGFDEEGHWCYFERFQKPWMDTIDRIVKVVGSTQALIDSTGVGDPIVEQLARKHGNNFEGFKITTGSKQQLMEGLAVAIQHEAISIPQLVADEAEEFEYQFTRNTVIYGAPEGFHDDCVMALSLCVQKLANLNGAMNMLKFYEMLMAKQKADGEKQPTLPAPRVPAVAKEVKPELLSPVIAYNAQLAKLTPVVLCGYCGKTLGTTYDTNGYASWHPECEPPMWQRMAAANGAPITIQ